MKSNEEKLLTDDRVRELAHNWEYGFSCAHTDDYTFNSIRYIEQEVIKSTPDVSELVEAVNEGLSWMSCVCGHPACKKCKATRYMTEALSKFRNT